MPDPLIVQQQRDFRRMLLAREEGQMLDMAQRWLVIEQRLRADMLALANEIERLRANGQAISMGKLQRLSALRSLLQQVGAELRGYTEFLEQMVGEGQAQIGALALEQAAVAISGRLIETGQLALIISKLPVEAIEAMIGMAGDGSPLRALFEAAWPDAVDAMLNELVTAVAAGQHPLETARRMAQAFQIGLQRAMNIARTEQLRIYRSASLMQYQASGVVRGYRRMSARDSRVCPACLMADDGTVYPLDRAFEEHSQGRCTAVPVLIGEPDGAAWETGQAWFERQDERTQQDILGKGRYDAWKSGAFDLPQIVSRKDDPVWGASLHPTPLYQLIGN